MSYRYIGNKTRLISTILNTIREFVPRESTVVDLMCGTASVAEAMRTSGYRVIATDMMTYSTHHARVRLLLDEAPHFDGLGLGSYFDVLQYLQTLRPRKGLFFHEYSPDGRPSAGVPPRMYFTSDNAKILDAISYQIKEWYSSEKITEIENSLLRHDLILAANRVANIAGTYGHYRSKWSNGSLSVLRLEPTKFIWGFRTDHVVLQGHAEDVASRISADLCYIDPPYMKRQYAANYHIIETLARGDEPEAIGMSGLRPWRDQYSNFCTKTKIFDSFTRVINDMDCDKFMISYSEDGLITRRILTEFFQTFGKVSSSSIKFNRFRSNDSSLGRELNEYVFMLEKTKRPAAFSLKPLLSFQRVSGAT